MTDQNTDGALLVVRIRWHGLSAASRIKLFALLAYSAMLAISPWVGGSSATARIVTTRRASLDA
jgi:hypothetical protein